MKLKPTILVIDDEPATLKVMEANLRREGYAVCLAADGQAGLAQLTSQPFDVVIADYMMPNLDGITLLEKMRATGLEVPVIIITAYGSIEHAVKAMQLGAANYLSKPINYDELMLVLRKTLEQSQLKREVERLRQEVAARYSFSNLVGKSAAMQRIYDLVTDVAGTDATVLIQGETGTGKELIAKAIHYNSGRQEKPFVGVSCAALPETLLESELFGHEKGAFTGALKTRIGRFEQADGGTIFLDEIGDIALATQAKLLRVLQERAFERIGGNDTVRVDVRVISATNKDLRKAIQQNTFREDLFYRLNVVLITVPPLRDRLEDLPLLAFHFLQMYASRFNKTLNNIEPAAIQLLAQQRWPGNVRELENVIERGVILEKSETLTRETIARCLLPGEQGSFHFFIYENMPFRTAKQDLLDRFEREYISRLLDKHKGNITNAAREAELDYKNFFEKMKRHGLSKWDFKESV
ncbi:MAG: sigma-54 dependent transcriptional regulator [candidate division KSB1 bacterium]|nr:sigma-54 dependent transcriptional regulator [candidate division KSB1 bacterium]MDZ7274094.1 sigma-54 dependent transcriptional regulator [candidate division KSB1 bacterium]MDZ7287861.1 sigma-54 dependent transcriptional regulator [candidate division KSB1 bacterium]MDZ7296693.1 sigma-54 dependent transcriptional regulator [candidate division KSB1 bacterium]MDZ7306937.1 sigma-54 dependent transcriptional regulator [candidate division KSB1 bacterium]